MRAVVDGDLDALARLWHEADELHARLSPGFFRRPDVQRGRQRASEALRDAAESEHETILVAVDGKEDVCGACHLQIYDTPVGHTMVSQRRGHIETLIVARAQRRRGIGRALMAAATEWAKSQGAQQLLLTVWAGNDDAERFYAALGYRTISQVLGTDL
ncbi:MAG TPA: GNAT family N-acetyltransferase [Polyangia bacterium]|nr:GNAT family N-acetyltransferase [Polyangia bacterium]